MTTYAVINRASGAEVYRYAHTAPVPWVGMEFATHDHNVVPDEVVPPPPAPPALIWNKFQYLQRFTEAERIVIREASLAATAQGRAIRDYFEMINVMDEIRSDDPYIVASLTRLRTAGLLAVGRPAEILGGA